MTKKILIAEDDESLQSIYNLILSNEGYDILLAENGKEAIEELRKTKVDLVLLDLMMPEVDGTDVLKAMRQNDWGKKTPVIVLTNIGKSESSLNLKQYDVLETVIKVDLLPDSLIALVQKHLAD